MEKIDIDAKMQEIAIITGATEEEIAQLKGKLKRASVEMEFTAEMMVKTMERMALRGNSTKEIVEVFDEIEGAWHGVPSMELTLWQQCILGAVVSNAKIIVSCSENPNSSKAPMWYFGG